MSKHTPPRAYFHVHHEQMWEWATEPMENRIEYIKKEKPTSEIDTRLRLLKEIPYERIKSLVDTKGQYDAVQRTAWEQYEAVQRTFDMEALHRELCPDCPWDGRTIFP